MTKRFQEATETGAGFSPAGRGSSPPSTAEERAQSLSPKGRGGGLGWTRLKQPSSISRSQERSLRAWQRMT